jgi:RHS repeat-associated protein
LTYLGLDTVVKRAHPQPNVDLTYLASDGPGNGGDQYKGLDLFGRVVDQAWQVTNTTTYRDRFQYGYDRDGNHLYRRNLATGAPNNLDELYHQNGAGNGYDALNQLTSFGRGTLNATFDALTTSTHSQSWTLDALGNWTIFQNNTNPAQNRSANNQNEITSIYGLSTPTYDNNGNTTQDETGKGFVFDAWNRLVQVKTSPTGTLLATYAFDPLGRRVQETESGVTRDLYFSTAWQVLEEDQTTGMTTTVLDQYVWSPVYVDAMVERDAPGQRLYVQQDANSNVTAVVSTSGLVQERYIYDPYRRFTDPAGQNTGVLDSSWNFRGVSSFGWVYLHQGGRYDPVAGLYSFRMRDFSPTLGRWVQVDPIGYRGGDSNSYGYEKEDPAVFGDPSGLEGGHHWFPQQFTRKLLRLCPWLKSANPNPLVGLQHHHNQPTRLGRRRQPHQPHQLPGRRQRRPDRPAPGSPWHRLPTYHRLPYVRWQPVGQCRGGK